MSGGPAPAPPGEADLAGAPLFDLRVRIATLFGAGRFPVAPGTVGSALTLPFAAGLAWVSPWALLAGAAASIPLAIWSAEAAERRFGVKDPSAVVVDEAAGQLAALAFVPLDLRTYVAGFLLFRLFDVVKPYPARRLERLSGGAGIVLDDVAAGVYANAALQLLLRLVGGGH